MPKPSLRNTLGEHRNEGARLLWLEMNRRGLSPNGVSALLGVGSGLVSRWLFCDGKPGRALSEKIRVELDVPPGAWDAAPSAELDLAELRTGTEG